MHSSVPDTLTTAKLFLIGLDKVEIIGGSTTRLVLIISCAVTRLPSNCQTCVSHVTTRQCTEAPERQGLSPNNQQTADSLLKYLRVIKCVMKHPALMFVFHKVGLHTMTNDKSEFNY